LPVDEQHRIAPLDINGIHKRAAELYHLLYHRIYGTRVVCLRLTNTYGPRQLLHHNRQGFIAWFIRQAMDGGVIELFGEGKQKRDLVYVDDVVDALLLAGASASTEGEIYNLGGAEPVSLADLANELIRLTGRGTIESKPFPPERRLIDIGNFYATSQKIESALGWRAKTSLSQGLARTIEFYTENREHYWNPHAGTFPRPQATAVGD
jgi:UDP-glucose 4-epimerase